MTDDIFVTQRREPPNDDTVREVYAWHARVLSARLDVVDHRTATMACRVVDLYGAQPWPDVGDPRVAADTEVVGMAPDLEAMATEARRVSEAVEGLREALSGYDPGTAFETRAQSYLKPAGLRAQGLEARCQSLAHAMARLRGCLSGRCYGWPPTQD